MKTFINKLKLFIGFYLVVLISLLLCVIATPFFIQHGISINSKVVIEEEILEFVLITALIGISALIFGSFRRTLNTYKSLVDQAKTEKLSLVSRLSEAFHYIGCVNSEIHSIQSIICDVSRYPKSKREFKQVLDHLTAKAAAVSAAPWAVIRIINKDSGRTVKEHAFEVINGTLPPATVGNRAILEGRYVENVVTIGASHNNIDLRTVCILPPSPLSKEETLLLSAITNQAELYFMLYRAATNQQNNFIPHVRQERVIYQDTAV